MKAAIAALLGAALLAGCAIPTQTGFFERDPADPAASFIYRVLADPDHPISERDMLAEKRRLEWIGYYMDTNALCAKGYSVVSRDAFRSSPVMQWNGNIVYRIRCKT